MRSVRSISFTRLNSMLFFSRSLSPLLTLSSRAQSLIAISVTAHSKIHFYPLSFTTNQTKHKVQTKFFHTGFSRLVCDTVSHNFFFRLFLTHLNEIIKSFSTFQWNTLYNDLLANTSKKNWIRFNHNYVYKRTQKEKNPIFFLSLSVHYVIE